MRPPASLLAAALLSALCLPSHAAAPAHAQFKVAVYIPVFQVERMMKEPAYLKASWAEISSQVHVDKVYIETYRSGEVADDAAVENARTFFKSQGIETAGGIAYVGSGDNAGNEHLSVSSRPSASAAVSAPASPPDTAPAAPSQPGSRS